MLIEIERFVNWVRRQSPGACTWRNYSCDLRTLVATVGDLPPDKVTLHDVDRFVNQQSKRGLKPATINRRLAAILSLYSYLSMEGPVLICPVIPRRHRLREPQRLPRPVPEEALRRFFGVITHVRDRAMFLLMLRCGLRISEVATLLLTDLYLDKPYPRLLIHGKGSRERAAYLSPQAERALREYLADRPSAASDYVFLSYQLDGLSTTAIHNRLMRYREQSGVSITAHRLRHSFANDLLNARVPITSIQKLLGHRWIETTQNYVMANDHQVQADYYAACQKMEGWKMAPKGGDLPSGNAINPLKKIAAVAGWCNQAHDSCLPPESSHPLPICRWSKENIESRNAEKDRLKVYHRWPEKFRCILNLERGQGDIRKARRFDDVHRAEGLPAWLVNKLECFQRIRQRNWRTARKEQNSRCFWSTHLNVWRFLCEQQSVHKLADLEQQHVLNYVDQRLNAGYAVTGVNGELRALHSFLAFLQDDGCAIPQSLLCIPALKLPDSLPKYLTDEQVRLLRYDFESRVAKARLLIHYRNSLLDRAVFYLLWQGGLRSGEVEELRLNDLDLDNRMVSIRDGKGRKDRTVYISNTTIHALQEYLVVRGKGPGDHVFRYRNAALKKDFIRSRIQASGERVGVRVYPHKLRHTCATQLLNAGCRVTSIQRFLGHKKLNTTMIYASVHNQTLAKDYFGAIR